MTLTRVRIGRLRHGAKAQPSKEWSCRRLDAWNVCCVLIYAFMKRSGALDARAQVLGSYTRRGAHAEWEVACAHSNLTGRSRLAAGNCASACGVGVRDAGEDLRETEGSMHVVWVTRSCTG